MILSALRSVAACALCAGLACAPPALARSGDAMTAADRAVPRYAHVVVIVEENRNFADIVNPAAAPNIARLAKTYGDATRFYGEVHPSEGNYAALLGGDTFGIHDDDAYYCKPGSTLPHCGGAAEPGYLDHTVRAPDLGDQLLAAGMGWKGYYESIPEPGSLAVTAGDPAATDGTRTGALYASKHSGFMNFASTQPEPVRKARILGFDQFEHDLASDTLPAFALVVPNQCNEMHGLSGEGIPADCSSRNAPALIRRGDAEIGRLVGEMQASAAWRSDANMAIVITFDEGSGGTREGCCGITPGALSNFGGGHIPTLVITNHGPRGVADDTPYSHYSLLRTLEDAFGLDEHLGHAADTAAGVQPMVKLFATPR